LLSLDGTTPTRTFVGAQPNASAKLRFKIKVRRVLPVISLLGFVLLDPLKEKLWSNDWLQRESGILALGAMAEGEQVLWVLSDRTLTLVNLACHAGCIESIEPHLPTLVPYLINTLNDPNDAVRIRYLSPTSCTVYHLLDSRSIRQLDKATNLRCP
jgi:hypothetical protein